MRKIITGILIIITAVSVVTGCSKAENAADYIAPALASISADEPTMQEEEPAAVQAIAFIEETAGETAIETTEKITETTPVTTAATEASTETVAETAPEPPPLPPVVIPQKPPRAANDKWLALTFDDGPGRYTQKILDLLEYHGGRATFFVVGAYVWNQRQVINNIIAQGSEAAGHSWHHYNLTQIDEQAVKDQITYTDNAILSITGVSPPKFFRPPFGAYNNIVREAAREIGTAIVLWNIDPRDWQRRDADYLYDYIMDKAADGAVILCHDIYETTAQAMERVIPDLIEQGYKLVTVSELLGETLTAGLIYYSEKHILN